MPREETYDARLFPKLERYRSGDPAYDYDLFGAALAVLEDAQELVVDVRTVEPIKVIESIRLSVQHAQDLYEPYANQR